MELVDKWGKYSNDGYINLKGKEFAIVFIMVCHKDRAAWLVMNNKQTQGLTEYAIPYEEGGEAIGSSTKPYNEPAKPAAPMRMLRDEQADAGVQLRAKRNKLPVLPGLPNPRAGAIQRDSGDRLDGWLDELFRAAQDELPKHAAFLRKKRKRNAGGRSRT